MTRAGSGPTMRAIAVRPGVAGSVHAREVARPSVDDVPDGRGVLVRVVRVGLCGTDHEIIDGLFGTPPGGDDHLILGHESLGEVVETGARVGGVLEPGALVVATVRRSGTSVYDRLGMHDFTTDPPIECGIWLGALLTTPVTGLGDAGAVVAALEDGDAVKAYVDVGPAPATTEGS